MIRVSNFYDMPVNRNALIRYKTIDTCLRNRFRRWTLENLIDACSDALYEYEGIDKGISKRTIQMDIQIMRSEKLGYNAPIVVYENKYYKYDDADYSITNIPLSEQDLTVMKEAVEILRQFTGFSHFAQMGGIISKLEDQVYSAQLKTQPVIDFEKNESLKGLHYLGVVYSAIINKQSLQMRYRSFKARSASNFIFYPYLLKEFRNRWFVYGKQKDKPSLFNLALDRIQNLEIDRTEPFVENKLFDPDTFFDNLVGVTKTVGQQTNKIRFMADRENAPYIETKPIHKSQKTIEKTENGWTVFELDVIINSELIREFLGFSNTIKIISPKSLASQIADKLKKAHELYNEGKIM